jgi:nucleotide-binding universal stress UspA family protein
MTHNIVVGVDGADNSMAALGAGAELAEKTESQLSVVFVRDVGPAIALAFGYEGAAELVLEQSGAELAVTTRERTFDLLADRPIEWTFDVVTGDAANELINVATTRAASLIVVGGRDHNLLGGLVLGSVAQKLVRSSQISVLVVRHPTSTSGSCSAAA